MKICTYNINSIKARKDLILEWLDNRGNDIDVLCFQELKTVDEGFPSADFEGLGYRCLVYGQKAYNGVATCTKIPPQEVQKGFRKSDWDEQRRIVTTKLAGLNIINVYAPHGGMRGEDKFVYKQNWYSLLLNFLKENYASSDPLIVLGDMNVAHQDIDVHSPELLEDSIGTMPEERKSFQDLLEWNLLDVFRELHPAQIQFTWWDYMGGAIWKDQGMRIDYILCTKLLFPKISKIGVDLWPRKRRKPTPSDHAPLIAEIDV